MARINIEVSDDQKRDLEALSWLRSTSEAGVIRAILEAEAEADREAIDALLNRRAEQVSYTDGD